MKLLLSVIALVLSIPQASAFQTDLKDTLHARIRNHRSLTYKEARVVLFNTLYLKNDQSGYYIEGMYCQKKHYPFGGQHPGRRLPDARVFNTEHVWPQSKFNSRFSKRAQKSDLHNLLPTFSRINSDRGNYPFADVRSERRVFCSAAEMGSPTRGGSRTSFEPPAEVKGDVARAMFYFSVRYQLEIDSTQETFLRIWHAQDPVDQLESTKHDTIAEVQGNRNPFIDDPELVSEIQDF